MTESKSMIQQGIQKFPSLCGKIALHVDNDTALGALHDFLMLIKGEIVARMVANQKQEEQQAQAQKELEKPADACKESAKA